MIANIEGLAEFTKGNRRSCEIFKQSVRKSWGRGFSLGVHYVKVRRHPVSSRPSRGFLAKIGNPILTSVFPSDIGC